MPTAVVSPSQVDAGKPQVHAVVSNCACMNDRFPEQYFLICLLVTKRLSAALSKLDTLISESVETPDQWGQVLVKTVERLRSDNPDLAALQIVLILAHPAPVEQLLAVVLPDMGSLRISAFLVVDEEERRPIDSLEGLRTFCGRYGGMAVRVAATWDASVVADSVAQFVQEHYARNPVTLQIGALSTKVTLSPSPLQYSPVCRIAKINLLGFIPDERSYVAGAIARFALTLEPDVTFSAMIAALQSQRVLAVAQLGIDVWGCLLAASGIAPCLLVWPSSVAPTWTTQLSGQSLLAVSPSYSMQRGTVTISAESVYSRVRLIGKLCKGLPDDAPELAQEINALLDAAQLLCLSNVRAALRDQLTRSKAIHAAGSTVIATFVEQLQGHGRVSIQSKSARKRKHSVASDDE